MSASGPSGPLVKLLTASNNYGYMQFDVKHLYINLLFLIDVSILKYYLNV